jgi:ketosteroid isomerase-like protein
MSQENVELVRTMVQAINARDAEAFIACLRPDVEWVESGDVLPGLSGTYRGPAEVRKWFEEAFMEVFDETGQTEIEEITQGRDDSVLLGAFITARGRASGVATELRAWNVVWFVDGKIASRAVFWNRAEALQAVGLSE